MKPLSRYPLVDEKCKLEAAAESAKYPTSGIQLLACLLRLLTQAGH